MGGISLGECDSGLVSLVLVAHFHGMAADADHLSHRLGLAGASTAGDLVRGARLLQLKARLVRTRWQHLSATPMPAIAELRDGRFCILGLVEEGGGRVLVQGLEDLRPHLLAEDEFAPLWTGRLVLLARRAAPSESGRRFGFAWFLPALYRYRRILAEVLASSFALQLFALASPIIFQVVVDKVLVHRGLGTLDVLILAMVLLGLGEVLLTALRNYTLAHTTNRVDVELGARLFDHLLALPLAYFEARRVGDSVARVRELENLRRFLTGSALTVGIDLLFIGLFLAVMFVYSTTLTWVVVASLPFYFALSAVATPVFHFRLNEMFHRGAENFAILVESVTGIETVKALAVEPQMQRQFEDQLAAYVGASFRVQTLCNNAQQGIQLIGKVTGAATLFLGAKAVIDGGLTVGELVAFNMLAAHVSAPVLRLAGLWQDCHQARVSVDRLGDILNTAREGGPALASPATPPPIRGHVRLDAITFRYRPDGPAVLSDINLEVPAGQMVGIVGSSGSGKSTLAKLLQRLYLAEQGRIFVDGLDLALVDAAWLRRQIGVVLQENTLFNRSVRANIALADPALALERVMAAAELAGAHEFIAQLPHGYDTVIGERGTMLSGGQRQRIAIARALVTDPRVLIFDEATSALDYESERVIQDHMGRITADRTVFVIAHRLSTVRMADRIVTIERGRLVEDGSHDELVRSDGRYALLHRLQAGESDVVARP